MDTPSADSTMSNELGDKRKARNPRISDDSKRQDRSSVAEAVIAIDRNNLEPAKELLNDLMRFPHLIHDPDLKFVKSFLLHFDCRGLPAENCGKVSSSGDTEYDLDEGWGEVECEEDDFLEERIDDKLQAPETIPHPPCGASPDVTPTEADIERATLLKQEAMQAVAHGDLNKAISCLSSALQMVPSALLYARRAEVLLLSQRPTAALADCDRALQLNPDSPRALKIRGQVQRAFGEWELASADLKRGLAIDHDDAAAQTLKVRTVPLFLNRVCPSRDDQRELDWMLHHLLQCVLTSIVLMQQECEEALEGVAQRRDARLQREKTRSVQRRRSSAVKEGTTGPQMISRDAMADIIDDPDMVLAMKNPKVLEAMKEVMANPAAVVNYVHDPEISMVITKLMVNMNSEQSRAPEAQSDETCYVADMDA